METTTTTVTAYVPADLYKLDKGRGEHHLWYMLLHNYILPTLYYNADNNAGPVTINAEPTQFRPDFWGAGRDVYFRTATITAAIFPPEIANGAGLPTQVMGRGIMEGRP